MKWLRSARRLIQPLVVVPLGLVALAPACLTVQAQGRADWMQEARWGVMTHYLADWIARRQSMEMDVAAWNSLVAEFDVEAFAEQIKSTGAGYLIFTIGQNSGYYAAPNATYDRLTGIQPSKCSRRDLILDLAKALQKRNIRLIAYLPAGAPRGDEAAANALEYQRGAHRNRDFQLKWEQIIREWSLRWGTNVAGWWFDGCYWPNAMYRHPDAPNFESFAAAARAGNPNSAVAFNRGVMDRAISITPFEDYTAGEINAVETSLLWRADDGLVDGARIHKLSYLGAKWGGGAPRYMQLEAVVLPWSRKIAEAGGAMTWDVPIDSGGRIDPQFLDQLKTIGRHMQSSDR